MLIQDLKIAQKETLQRCESQAAIINELTAKISALCSHSNIEVPVVDLSKKKKDKKKEKECSETVIEEEKEQPAEPHETDQLSPPKKKAAAVRSKKQKQEDGTDQDSLIMQTLGFD